MKLQAQTMALMYLTDTLPVLFALRLILGDVNNTFITRLLLRKRVGKDVTINKLRRFRTIQYDYHSSNVNCKLNVANYRLPSICINYHGII